MLGHAVERHQRPLHSVAIAQPGVAQIQITWATGRLVKIAATTAAACRVKEPDGDPAPRHLLEDNPASG